MARVQLLLCFTILLASVTLLDLVSAHLKYKPALPQIEDPKTVNDVEAYTVKVVMVFVSDLEKECPKTNKFKAFFEKLRGYAKYVCPIKRSGQVDYDRDMKAKAGGLVRAISSFAIGKIREEIQEEKTEVINTFKFMRFVASKILGGRKESEASMTLTAEQQKEIKEGILRWQTIMTRITNTMVMSTTTSSSSETSTTKRGGSSGDSESSGSGKSSFNGKSSFEDTTGSSSFQDTTGSSSDLGSPSGSPSSSPSGSSSSAASGSGSETSSTDTNSGSSVSGNVESSQSSSLTVQQVETETSKDVSTFIMNLEKKCPQKEEFKAFFEQLKGTMIAPRKERKGLFSRIRSAAGKLSGAMAFLRSRIGSKSEEVKKSMEAYQEQVTKTLQELETIHSQIVSQNKGKKEGSLTCTPAQQMQIKQTITRWEQVTTQFVETAAQSETQSSSTSSSSVGKMISN